MVKKEKIQPKNTEKNNNDFIVDIDKIVSNVVNNCPDEDFEIPGADAAHSLSQKRTKARDETINEIYAAFQEKPNPSLPETEKIDKKYPCYCIRKMLGCAHVDIHTAVVEGNFHVIEKTILRLSRTKPHAINERNKKGCTALSLAVKIKRDDIVELLLTPPEVEMPIEIDLNAKDEDDKGMAPIHHAVQVGSIRILSRLLRREADVDISNVEGTTPIMMACRAGKDDMVRLLLKYHADPEIRDKFGWNALFYAAYGGHVSTTEIILDEGVDKLLKDYKKRRAIDWAEKMNHGAVASLIERHRLSISKKK